MPVIQSRYVPADGDKERSLVSHDAQEEAPLGEQKPLLRVALYQPEIPQNTGNIARTCAATRIPLHLVEPLGFRLSDRHLKRAGLDYWPRVSLKVHARFEDLRQALGPARMVYLSARASRPYYAFRFLPGDCLVFGSETSGLPEEMVASEPDRILKIPIDRTRVRSLNLATCVGVVVFEALRQLSFTDQEPVYSWSCGPGGSSESEGSPPSPCFS